MVDLRQNLSALAASSQAAQAAGYKEKVPVSDLDEVLHMTPMPFQEFSTLNNCVYCSPFCLLALICGVYERLKLEPEELVMQNGTCMTGIERKRE